MRLSWDLFIMVFFAIVIAYSFIIGRKDILKIIIATYVATLCADGVGNLLASLLNTTSFFPRLMGFLGVAAEPIYASSIIKILLLITIIVILTILGDYEVQDPPSGYHPIVKIMSVSFLAFLSGALILSSVFVIANGGSLISGTTGISEGFMTVYKESRFIKWLLDWHDIWFSLPGVAFAIISIWQKNKAA